jgi:predicted nucleic acid-binding Zn ribbon protein
MYHCTDCGFEFEFVEVVFETHGLDTPPYERIKRCPSCKSRAYEEVKNTHCRFCGSKLRETGEYCSESCEKSGREYFARERENRAKFASSPISAAVREVAAYNKKNATKYSYGQYFALKEAGKI